MGRNMSGAARSGSTAARVARSAIVLALGLAAAWGIEPLLRAIGLHDWSKRIFGPHGFYELYITCVFVLTLVATFVFTKWLGKLLGVERKLAELIAAGTSICGL